jgi:hypothetical protein
LAGKNLLTLSAEYDIKKTGVEMLLSFYLCGSLAGRILDAGCADLRCFFSHREHREFIFLDADCAETAEHRFSLP